LLNACRSLDFSFNNLRSLLLPPSHAAAATPPLEALAKLEQVYLIQNKISRIEGLTGPGLAQNLRSLELGGNRIRVSHPFAVLYPLQRIR
jgi:Leucine-rich repeat (LRR) protein